MLFVIFAPLALAIGLLYYSHWKDTTASEGYPKTLSGFAIFNLDMTMAWAGGIAISYLIDAFGVDDQSIAAAVLAMIWVFVCVTACMGILFYILRHRGSFADKSIVYVCVLSLVAVAIAGYSREEGRREESARVAAGSSSQPAAPSSLDAGYHQSAESAASTDPITPFIKWTFTSGLVDCSVERGEALQLRCRRASLALSSLAHPALLEVPREVGDAFAVYRMEFLDLQARCMEYPVVAPLSEPQSTLLVVFLSDASLPDQAGWFMDAEARCRRLRVVQKSPGELPIIQHPMKDPLPHQRRVGWEDVATLRPGPKAERALDTGVAPRVISD
jgi:hypothetical protein